MRSIAIINGGNMGKKRLGELLFQSAWFKTSGVASALVNFPDGGRQNVKATMWLERNLFNAVRKTGI